MDFGLDCLVGLDQGSAPDALPDPAEAKLKVVVGSGPFKLERPRSSVSGDDEEWRNSKLVKTTDDFSIPKAMPKDATRSNGVASLFWDTQHRQQMLSFSSSSSSPSTSHKLETLPNSHNASSALPYLRYAPLSYNSFAEFSSGNLNGVGSIRGVLTGTKGPFTRSQWMEFEHQALIYKYITANIHVPSNLLIPIKKAFDSTGFLCSPGGYLRSSHLGWGSFHLGFSNTGDTEPGRCRRTDGKKWRCSRDAVADQKYCEKHMNRGRHRSRKPVEGQNGHPVTGTTITAHASSRKIPVVSSTSAAGGTVAAAAPGCGASDSLATMAHQQHMKCFLHPGVLSTDASLKRFFDDRESVNHKKQNPNSLSVISPSKDNLFPMMKQQLTYKDASRLQFTLDNSYSLLDDPNKNSSLLDCRGFDSFLDLAGSVETDTPHGSSCLFIDDWHENSVDRSDSYLSISIPMASSDLISATSFPTNDKASLLPLRLSQKSDPRHMNLGVASTIFGEPFYKQNISWESSLGGPLGEVLHQTSSNTNNAESKNSSLLNFMNDGCDNSPSMGSSPRGVLQRATFCTLSNSSGVSSPCAENNKSVNGINEHLGLTIANTSLPAL